MTDSFEHQMEENAVLLARLAPSPVTRRRVLLGSGAAALGLVAAACGTDDDPFVLQDEPDPDLIPPPEEDQGGEAPSGEQPTGDVATATLAASLEVLAVNTYQAALDAAGEGTLANVPEAVATFISTAQGHHVAHRDAWNNLLTTLGEAEVTEPPSELAAEINTAFGQAGDVVAVAELALRLEQTAADTYFEAIPTIE
ncbi:MAG TPA: ferritin-like domain-containing protein, partial [Acidimicrobiales bacterium]|nr:ferritin-like domain-containing protein [Acidimicrobiales bacterium]